MATKIGTGHHIRVNHPGSWYHGEKGVVIGQGSAWGRLIVEIVSTRDGKTHLPEIRRGHLELVQEGENHEISRHSPH